MTIPKKTNKRIQVELEAEIMMAIFQYQKKNEKFCGHIIIDAMDRVKWAFCKKLFQEKHDEQTELYSRKTKAS